MTACTNPTDTQAALTDVGPATPPPNWCLPGAEGQWEYLTAELGGGSVCLSSRNVPDDPSADVWIEASYRIIGGPGDAHRVSCGWADLSVGNRAMPRTARGSAHR